MEPFCVNVVSNVEFVAAMYRCLILHLLAGSRARHHRRLFRFPRRFLCLLARLRSPATSLSDRG